jgi:ankyrin repeat protein
MSDERNEMLIQIVVLGKIEILRKLLARDENIDLNLKDEYGHLPVIEAAKRNNLPMVKLLVKHGAKLHSKDGAGRNVEGWANKHKNKDMINFLKQDQSHTPQTKSKSSTGKDNFGSDLPNCSWKSQ